MGAWVGGVVVVGAAHAVEAFAVVAVGVCCEPVGRVWLAAYVPLEVGGAVVVEGVEVASFALVAACHDALPFITGGPTASFS